jgi:hypothetical protein
VLIVLDKGGRHTSALFFYLKSRREADIKKMIRYRNQNNFNCCTSFLFLSVLILDVLKEEPQSKVCLHRSFLRVRCTGITEVRGNQSRTSTPPKARSRTRKKAPDISSLQPRIPESAKTSLARVLAHLLSVVETKFKRVAPEHAV